MNEKDVNVIKGRSFADATVNVNKSLIEPSDFDCVLCYRPLWRPVVTPCGHTYCSVSNVIFIKSQSKLGQLFKAFLYHATGCNRTQLIGNLN